MGLRMRKWMGLAIGCVFIGLSLFLYMQFTNHYKTVVMTMWTYKPFRPLQAGETITTSLVHGVMIPVAAHDPLALMDLKQIVGKRVEVPMSTNEEFAGWKLTNDLIAPEKGQQFYSFQTDALENVANIVRRGDRVDVWMELDKPWKWQNEQGEMSFLGSVKLLENVLVADVKSSDGGEVTDNDEGNHGFADVNIGAMQNSMPDLKQVRANPNAKPGENTYIMTEAEYNVYVLGELMGKIKLSLSTINSPATGQSRITDMFYKLQSMDFFEKEAIAR